MTCVSAFRRRPGRRARAVLAGAIACVCATAPTAHADGTILRTITAANDTCLIGTGLAFDGRNLLLSCDYDNVITAINPADGSVVHSYTIANIDAIGAMAYDRQHGVVWACGGFGGDDTSVYRINLVTQTAALAFSGGPGCPDGLAYDGSDQTLWLSPDVSPSVYHYKLDGTQIASYPANLGGCGNSGIAVGGPYLYLSNDGCSQIYRALKSDPAQTTFFGSYPARLEDLECDDVTFRGSGFDAIWSKDAYDGILNAFSIPAGSCGFGGQSVGSTYVALGDSYSSGEGIQATYLSGTDADMPRNRCHRSALSYPFHVNLDLGFYSPRFSFHACSGALVEDFYRPNHGGNTNEPAQLSWLDGQKGADAKLVTLTIGGNDAHFASVVWDCWKQANHLGGSCVAKWRGPVDDAIAQMGRTGSVLSLTLLYDRIAGKALHARIIVVGYPRFFPKRTPLFCATGAGGWFDIWQMSWMNAEVKKMDDTIGGTVAAMHNARVRYVDAYDAFNGHELCTARPYMNAVIPSLNGNINAGSFHPNIDGQRTLAQLVEARAR